MNIACVAYLGSRGGAQRQIILLANHLAREGHDVSLINLAGGCALYDVCPNVTLYNISLENQIKSLGQRFLALHSFLKKIKPDVSIHYWLQSAYFCAFMLVQGRKRPVFHDPTLCRSVRRSRTLQC